MVNRYLYLQPEADQPLAETIKNIAIWFSMGIYFFFASLEIFSTKFQARSKLNKFTLCATRTLKGVVCQHRNIILISEEHIKMNFYDVRAPSKQCNHYNISLKG